MAYEVVILYIYHLVFLGAFTEYPFVEGAVG